MSVKIMENRLETIQRAYEQKVGLLEKQLGVFRKLAQNRGAQLSVLKHHGSSFTAPSPISTNLKPPNITTPPEHKSVKLCEEPAKPPEQPLEDTVQDYIRTLLSEGVPWPKLVEVLRKVLHSRDPPSKTASDKPRFSDGIQEAGEVGQDYELQFYRSSWVPPLDHWGTVCELKLWMDPLGNKLWPRPVLSGMLHDIKVIQKLHSAGEPASTVVPLALYTFQLYHEQTFAVWVPDPSKAVTGGQWMSLGMCPFGESEDETGEMGSAAEDGSLKESSIVSEEGGTELTVQACVQLSPLLNRPIADLLGARFEMQRTSPGLVFYNGMHFWFKFGICHHFVVKLNFKNTLPTGSVGATHIVIASYSNPCSANARLSPLHASCLWLPPPTMQIVDDEIKPSPARRASAPVISMLCPDRSPFHVVQTPVETIPCGVLEYIYSRDASEKLCSDMFDVPNGKPVWEVVPFEDDDRLALLLERISHLENKQAFDTQIAKDTTELINFNHMASRHYYQAVSSILHTALQYLGELTEPIPNSVAAVLALQRFRWKQTYYLISLSHASVKIVCKEDGTQLAIYERLNTESEEQPYRLLNHTMRSIQLGQMVPTLILKGFSACDGEYEGGGAIDPFIRSKPVEASAQWNKSGFDLYLGRADSSSRIVERVTKGWRVLPRGSSIHQVKSAIFHIDKSLKAAPGIAATHPLMASSIKAFMCYRGLEGVAVPQYRNGAVLLWASFSSTSLDALTACSFASDRRRGTVFSVQASSTTQGKIISRWSRFARERELLFPPNTWLKVGNVMSSALSVLAGVRGQSQLFELEVVTPTTVHCARVRSLLPRVATAAAASVVFQMEEAIKRGDGVVDLTLSSPTVGETAQSWQCLVTLSNNAHLANCPVREVSQWTTLSPSQVAPAEAIFQTCADLGSGARLLAGKPTDDAACAHIATILGIDRSEMTDAVLCETEDQDNTNHRQISVRGKKRRHNLDMSASLDKSTGSNGRTAPTTGVHWEAVLDLRITHGRGGLACGIEGVKLLAAALRMKVPLRRLALRNNRIPSNGVALLLEALRENPHIIEVETDPVPTNSPPMTVWKPSDELVCKRKTWNLIRSNVVSLATKSSVWYDDQLEPAMRLRCIHHRSHGLTLNQLHSFGEKWAEITVKAMWDVVDVMTVLPSTEMGASLDWVVHAIGREWARRDLGKPNHLLLASARLGRVALVDSLLNAFSYDLEVVIDVDNHSALYYACRQKAFDTPEAEPTLSRLVTPRLLRIQSKLGGYTPLHAATHTYSLCMSCVFFLYGQCTKL